MPPLSVGQDAGPDTAAEAATDTAQTSCPWPVAPQELTLGTPVMDTVPAQGDARNRNTSCTENAPAGTPGPERVYLLRVPTRTGIALSVSRTDVMGTGDLPETFPVAAIRSACDDMATELACAAWWPTSPGNVGVTHGTLEAGSYFVVVDRIETATVTPAPMPFRLEVATFALASNATCAAPTTLTPGAALTDQRIAEGGRGASAPVFQCERVPFIVSDGLGPRRYYAVTVPAQSVLTVSAAVTTGSDTDRVLLELADACSDSNCRAGAGSEPGAAGAGRAPAVVRLANTGAQPITEVVVVARDSDSSDTLLYSVEAQVGPLPFAESAMSAACDDMSTATTLPVGKGAARWGFQVSSPVTDLPFVLPWFGAPHTRFIARSSGYVQLLTADATPDPRHLTMSGRIPSVLSPGVSVAPLWTSWDVDSAPAVRAASFTGPTRYTLEWSGFRSQGTPALRGRFQLKLFDTGAVEFHYCDLSAVGGTITDLVNVLTIGLQDDGYTSGMRHTGGPTPGGAIRYAPR